MGSLSSFKPGGHCIYRRWYRCTAALIIETPDTTRRTSFTLGFASKDVMYYEEEFRALGDTRIATDDGSAGLQGNVGNLLLAAEQTRSLLRK